MSDTAAPAATDPDALARLVWPDQSDDPVHLCDDRVDPRRTFCGLRYGDDDEHLDGPIPRDELCAPCATVARAHGWRL